MRAHKLLGFSTLGLSAFLTLTLHAQSSTSPHDPPDAPSADSARSQGNDVVEGTVISTSRHTLVVQSGDNKYHLFTYDGDTGTDQAVRPGARVRVQGGAPDDDGTQVAENVAIVQPGSDAATGGVGSQAAPPPPQVRHVTRQIENDARRWHAGGRIGVGFSPELFLFGLQSQIGPIFSPRLLFRPNAEFGFGELTDMFSVNLEGAYRFNTTFRRGWTPYFGMGPSLNFIHRGASSGDVSFSDFTYKTGFNVFVGAQKRKTFVEMKTALWSDNAPVLRLLLGYNF